MNLYYLHFNNYYNRIVKKFDTLAEYLTLPYYDNVATNDIAFNPNDGVDTRQVANVPTGNEFTYDYAILADGNDIVSRWFIIDANRNLNGQYTLTLRRDMFVDSYEPVLDAPAFIEKATLNNNDPMIFNSEDMTFNQIKTSETLLKDETGCPWIVGYIARNTADNQRQDYSISFTPKTAIDFEVDLTTWEYKDYTQSNPFVRDWNIYYSILYKKDSGSGRVFQNFNSEGIISTESSNSSTSSSLYYPSGAYTGDFKELANELNQYIGSFKETHTAQEFTTFLNLNGKVIYDTSSRKKYRVNLIRSSSSGSININSNSAPTLFNTFKSKIPNGNEYSFGYGWNNVVGYFVVLTEMVENQSYTLTIEDRFTLQGAPYDMFCIPYTNELQVFKNGELQSASSKEIGFAAAMEMARVYGNDGNAKFLYDLQLLPYCPARFAVQDDGTFDVGNNDLGITYIKGPQGQNVCPVLFVSNDNFTFNIALENPITISDYKVESQCDMYRLSSPNYNGIFEFNAAKNGGVSFFNVDCTYKPYNPYIHINPNFGKLYGEDFNDSRGLVVGGDFSLPQTTSAWESYQLSNKNFQASFDRQIENMEVNNSIQNQRAVVQAALGTVQGAVAGASAGVGPISKTVGAIAGGAASAAAGALDIALQKRGQAEAIDYTKDQFGYSLGNIKALAQGLSKTSALVFNNKLFPFLEYYTCTEKEKQALRNKIKYNGMTVMRIGSIREFLQSEKTYIKGQIIRFENFDEDFHYVNELANEFNKGVFI